MILQAEIGNPADSARFKEVVTMTSDRRMEIMRQAQVVSKAIRRHERDSVDSGRIGEAIRMRQLRTGLTQVCLATTRLNIP